MAVPPSYSLQQSDVSSPLDAYFKSVSDISELQLMTKHIIKITVYYNHDADDVHL